MPLVTVDECLAFVATPINHVYLSGLIDDIESQVTERVGGPDTAVTEAHAGYVNNIFVRRPILSISSLTEYSSLIDGTGVTLTEGTDFFTWGNEGRIQRLGGKWSARVSVTYLPQDDSSKRRRAIIDLVRIALSTMPLKAESISGEYAYTFPDSWEEEREKVIRRLKFPTI